MMSHTQMYQRSFKAMFWLGFLAWLLCFSGGKVLATETERPFFEIVENIERGKYHFASGPSQVYRHRKRMNRYQYVSGSVDLYYVKGSQQREACFGIEPPVPRSSHAENQFTSIPSTLMHSFEMHEPTAQQVAKQLQEDIFFGYHMLPAAQRNSAHYFATNFEILERLGFKLESAEDHWAFPQAWYTLMKQASATRRAAWKKPPSFHENVFPLQEGTELRLIDYTENLAPFMQVEGHQPQQAFQVQDGVTAVWDGGKEILLRLDERLTGTHRIRFETSHRPEGRGMIHESCENYLSSVVPTPKKAFEVTVQRSLPRGNLVIHKHGEVLDRWEKQEIEGMALYTPVFAEGPMPGVGFAIHCLEPVHMAGQDYAAGEKVASLTTDVLGLAQVTGLPLGAYELREVAPPIDYLPAHPQRFVIEAQHAQEPLRLSIENQRIRVTLHGIKRFEGQPGPASQQLRMLLRTVEPLASRQGDLPAQSLVGISPLTVQLQAQDQQQDHRFSWTLPGYGHYQIEELHPPAGYQAIQPLLIAPKPEEGRAPTPLHELSMDTVLWNRLAPRLEVFKYDASSEPARALAGASFQLYEAGQHGMPDRLIEEKTSDEAGKLVFYGLSVGHYRLKESKAPTGYQALKDFLDFEMKEGMPFHQLGVPNHPIPPTSQSVEPPRLTALPPLALLPPIQAVTPPKPSAVPAPAPLVQAPLPMEVLAHKPAMFRETSLPRTGERSLQGMALCFFGIGVYLACKRYQL